MKNRLHLWAKPRFFPILIFGAAALMSIKLGGVWQGIDTALAAGAAPDTAVGKGQASKGEKALPRPPARLAAVRTEDQPNSTARQDGKTDPSKDAPAVQAPPPAKGKDAARRFDPHEATDQEIDVLQRLAARHAALKKQEKAYALRVKVLRASEQRIDTKLAELKKIRGEIKQLLKSHDAQQKARLKSLVKIYESMKPKDAARIFEQLEMQVLLDVVEGMREAKSAPIIANMDPGKAKEVTIELAQRRSLPAVGEAASGADAAN